jgi:hypothetical protein
MTTLNDRAALVPIRGRKGRAGKDPRGDAEYAAALARQTAVSLASSPNWRAGLPLEEGERWRYPASEGLAYGDDVP